MRPAEKSGTLRQTSRPDCLDREESPESGSHRTRTGLYRMPTAWRCASSMLSRAMALSRSGCRNLPGCLVLWHPLKPDPAVKCSVNEIRSGRRFRRRYRTTPARSSKALPSGSTRSRLKRRHIPAPPWSRHASPGSTLCRAKCLTSASSQSNPCSSAPRCNSTPHTAQGSGN